MDDSNITETPADAEDLFLNHFMPSTDDDKSIQGQGEDTTKATDEAEETNEEARPDNEDHAEPEADEGSDAEQEQEGPEYLENDDVFVKYKVDGQEHQVSVKDLKRLAGQEASLTNKSKEVAAHRKQLETAAQVQVAALDKLLARAKSRWEPYSKLDFFEVASKLDADSLKALRDEAQARYEDVQFLEGELNEFANGIQKQRHEDLSKAAKECVKALTDPLEGIEGWNQQLYTDICKYATDNGIQKEAIDTLVDPASFKILRKAMLYDQGKNAVQKIVPKKKDAPKKIVKSSNNANETKKIVKGADKAQEAMKRLRETGDTDDAAAVFFNRFTKGSDE